jgi:hypothetical protein
MQRDLLSLFRLALVAAAVALLLGACKDVGWSPPGGFTTPAQCYPRACSFGGI